MFDQRHDAVSVTKSVCYSRILTCTILGLRKLNKEKVHQSLMNTDDTRLSGRLYMDSNHSSVDSTLINSEDRFICQMLSLILHCEVSLMIDSGLCFIAEPQQKDIFHLKR